jgi:hypothetical protein
MLPMGSSTRRFARARRARQTRYKVLDFLSTPFLARPLSLSEGMPQMASNSDQTSFAAMLAQSEMHVPPEQVPSLFEGYQHMIRMVALLGAPSTLEAEPAVIFTTDQR